MLKNARRLALPLDMQIELFNTTVKPVILYGCEIWGYGNVGMLERLQLKFLKYILNIRKSTPDCFVYGKNGVLPLKIDIQHRILSYWTKLLSRDENSITRIMYDLMKAEYNTCKHTSRNKTFGWLHNIYRLLITCGFSGLWQTNT